MLGTIASDVDVRTSAKGTAVAKFSLAVPKKFANQQGKHESTFIRCIAFKGVADFCAKYLAKGGKIAIEGAIDSGSYEKLRTAAELLAEKLNVPVKVHLRDQNIKVKKFPAWIGFIFLFGFSGLGGLALYLHVCQPLYRSLRAQEFQPVSAVVTQSKIVSERHKSKNSSYTVYKADISFAYMVKGKKYSSNNYTYFDDFSRSSSRANAMVRKHPAGKQITCYINPANPYQAVVDRKIPCWELASEALGYTFFLVMGFVIFAILRAQRNK